MAYLTELETKCVVKKCQNAVTCRVFGRFSDTNFLDGFYCQKHGEQRVFELNLVEGRQNQLQDVLP